MVRLGQWGKREEWKSGEHRFEKKVAAGSKKNEKMGWQRKVFSKNTANH